MSKKTPKLIWIGLWLQLSSVGYGQMESETRWLRLQNEISHLKVDHTQFFLAFQEQKPKPALKVLDLRTKKIFSVESDKKYGPGTFWAPGGSRIFFLSAFHNEKLNRPQSDLKTFDLALKASVPIASFPHKVGFPSFDPRDYQIYLLHEKGIHRRRLKFPTQRIADWQYQNTQKDGYWVTGPKGVLWVSNNGISIRRMKDDKKPITSFDVSSDGRAIAWATEGGNIYVSKDGIESTLLDRGQDPVWHPGRTLLAYAGGRKVGNKIISFDLKVSDLSGRKRWLTATQFSSERWPGWIGKGSRQLIYTKSKTTDLYVLENFQF